MMLQELEFMINGKKKFQILGMVQMQDEETGELMLVNTASKKVRHNYGKLL